MFSIALNQATVNFDEHFSLEAIDWNLDSSQHWAITGPNGAGKSALAASLAGYGELESGSINGVPERIAIVSFEAQSELIEAERQKDDADILDVIPEGTPVQELLDEGCANQPEQKRLVKAFNFEYALERSFRKLSTGETRKVLLIKALTGGAELLILDEPFEGLDIDSDAFLRVLLQEYSEHIPMVFVLNRFDEIPEFVTNLAYIEKARLQHLVNRHDNNAVGELKQLLHLKTSDLNIPPKDDSYNASNGKATSTTKLNPGEPLVTLRNATIAYGDKVIFSDLNWTIEPGIHWQVSGPNGSGKTCLLNLITGDHPQCYVNDINVFGMQRGNGESIWEIKQHIGYVSSALQWEYKVGISVRNAIISGFYDSIGIYQQYSDTEKDIAEAWLEVLGMAERADLPFNQLSFGDQRLVLIARAMVKHPPLLILDEPCLGLDDLNRQLVLALIERLCAGSETTVLYVNHRLEDKIAGIEHNLQLHATQHVAGSEA